jgi:hypothetical protein
VSTTDAIRTRIAARVLTANADLRESVEVYPFIRQGGHSPIHLEVAIAIVESEAIGDRGRAPSTFTREAVRVLLAYQLAPKDRVTSLATLHQMEASIRSALLTGAWTIDFTLPRWETTTREAGLDGWVWSESAFSVYHQLTV